MRLRHPVFGLALATLLAAAASAEVPVKTGESAIGPVLVNEHGMTLYTFDKDADGKSACTGGCAANWPPLSATADAQPDDDYAIIDREDGTRQWTYYGNPLYLWIKDKAPGDVTGDGANGVWHAAKPE